MVGATDELSLVFQALADPARRGMLARLASGPASVSELAQPLKMSLPAVMQHLKALEDAGLVAAERTGREVKYRATTERLAEAVSWLLDAGESWDRRSARLAGRKPGSE